MNLVAVLIIAVSMIQSGDQCFNKYYPAPVIAEDHSVIECPAVYYAPDVQIESSGEWKRYAENN